MTARSPGAFTLSLLLHAAVVVAALLFTYSFKTRETPPPTIFELVAGAGSNYAATEAPKGSDAPNLKLKFETNDEPLIKPRPEPEPEPEPEQAEPVITPMPEPTKPVVQKSTKPTPKTPVITKAEPETQKTSYKDFQKQNSGKTNASQSTAKQSNKPISAPRITAPGVKDGTGKPGEGAGGNALSRAEGDLMDAYLALLRNRLKTAHEKPSGLSDYLSCEVAFTINGSSGAISGVRITRSSGDSSFDASVLAAFRAVSNIGPPPTGKTISRTLTFKMRE